MSEERKSAPLPPLPPMPWKVHLNPWYARTKIVDDEGCVLAEIVGADETAITVADLFCRAPALESEVVRLKVQLEKQTRIVEQLNATRNRREDDIDALNEELHRREQAR